MVAYFKSIWQCRHFWMSLVKMDLRSRYRGSVLGLGWSLLNPIAMTIILCIVFSTLFQQKMEYFAPMVMAGLTYWAYILYVTTYGCVCFFQGDSYIRQFPAPMAIYPLRTMLNGMFHLLLAMLMVVILTAVMWRMPQPMELLLLLPTLLLLAIFGWSLALIFGLATVRFRDTKHISEIVFQALFYITPIMYPEEMLAKRKLGIIMQVNPFAYFLKLLRDPLLEGGHPLKGYYIGAALITLATVLLAGVLMRSQEKELIFHL